MNHRFPVTDDSGDYTPEKMEALSEALGEWPEDEGTDYEAVARVLLDAQRDHRMS